MGNRVGILPSMGSGNWLVLLQRLMAMVAMGLGQFQRFLSCDLCIGLQTPLSGYCSGPDLMVTRGYRLATFSQDLPLSFSLPPPCSLYPKLPLGTFYFF